jgi:hypothetical protein
MHFHGMDEFDLNIQGFVIILGDDVIRRDNGAEMGQGRMGCQNHKCRRNHKKSGQWILCAWYVSPL